MLDGRTRPKRIKVVRLVSAPVEWLAAPFIHAAQHVDMTLVTLGRRPATEAALTAAGIKIVPLEGDPQGNFRPTELYRILDDERADALMTFGWSKLSDLALLSWGTRHGVPVVLVTDTNAFDYQRQRHKEFIKSHILSLFSAAWAAGPSAADYLVELGIKADRIVVGYTNVIDWDHFYTNAQNARSDRNAVAGSHHLPDRYFLTVSRFSPEKNIPGLLRAFHRYRIHNPVDAWDLVLVGGGPSRDDLRALAMELGIDHVTHFVGWKSFGNLPAYYALAGAFVLASTRETWAVVVNEAATCGLPLLVSNRCGSAASFIKEGVNGFTFDPEPQDALPRLMAKLASGEVDRTAMADESVAISRAWHPRAYGERHFAALQRAVESPAISSPRWKTLALDLAVTALHASLTRRTNRSDVAVRPDAGH